MKLLKKGDSYEDLKKCIHVSILDFIHFPGDEKCYRTVRLCDVEDGREYTDLFELQFLELPKLPRNIKSGEDIIQWMRFFNGKSQEEFEMMAKENEYFDEAYTALKEMSADEQKRIEYEAREKALKDYNTQMSSALKRGIKQGLEEGREAGREEGRKQGVEQGLIIARQMFILNQQGKSYEEIAEICETTVEKVKEVLAF